METRKIIRGQNFGVFFGEVEGQDGSTLIVTNARRIWYWDGAASLSELAESGPSKPQNCKFPTPVGKVKLFNCIEVLDVTEEAGKAIDAVKIWKS